MVSKTRENAVSPPGNGVRFARESHIKGTPKRYSVFLRETGRFPLKSVSAASHGGDLPNWSGGYSALYDE
jgi:hypothetical protein